MMHEKPDERSGLVYSVVVPVFNAVPTLEELVLRLGQAFQKLGESFEVVFIDDSSTDQSWERLRSLRAEHPWIRCYQLTRNFGQQNATMCGLSLARGRYIITIDDDLQNPPEEIPKLVSEIKKGYDVVFGIYRFKKHNLFRRMGSLIVNKFYGWTFQTRERVSAFRIMRSELAQKIQDYDLNFTYINGLIAWYTNRISRVVVDHKSRDQGRSSYTLKKLLALSINMMTNFSLLPLQVASLFGLFFALLGFVLGSFFVTRRLIFGTSVNGFTAIITSISFFSGMILFFLGIIGEYIGRIHMNINRKPQFNIRLEHNDQEDDSAAS